MGIWEVQISDGVTAGRGESDRGVLPLRSPERRCWGDAICCWAISPRQSKTTGTGLPARQPLLVRRLDLAPGLWSPRIPIPIPVPIMRMLKLDLLATICISALHEKWQAWDVEVFREIRQVSPSAAQRSVALIIRLFLIERYQNPKRGRMAWCGRRSKGVGQPECRTRGESTSFYVLMPPQKWFGQLFKLLPTDRACPLPQAATPPFHHPLLPPPASPPRWTKVSPARRCSLRAIQSSVCWH